MNNWGPALANPAFASLTTLPSAVDCTEGNVVGLNPFHDYETWQILHDAKRVVARRFDACPVAALVNEIKMERHTAHMGWLVANAKPY